MAAVAAAAAAAAAKQGRRRRQSRGGGGGGGGGKDSGTNHAKVLYRVGRSLSVKWQAYICVEVYRETVRNG